MSMRSDVTVEDRIDEIEENVWSGTHLVNGWLPIQEGRVVGRERVFVILGEVDAGVLHAADEDDVGACEDDVLYALEEPVARDTLCDIIKIADC